jgi:tryptophanyl-tRNA synthetase
MEEKPGISNLLTIMSAITGEDIDDIAKRYDGQGYGVFKKAVADVVVNELSDLQAKVKQIQSSGIIDKILEEGAQKASFIARKKLAKVYRKIGLR